MYFYYCSSIPITVYRFLLSVTVYRNSYLVWSNSQHKVTSSSLWRQFSILLYHILEAIGQAMTITAVAFVLVPQHNTTLRADKTSRMCLSFLQSTPQQNWIPLSVYQNRSELIRSLSRSLCSCHNIRTGQYSLLLQYNSTNISTTKHDTNNTKMYKELF